MTVIIPVHPWETENGIRLWYSLVWTEGSGTDTELRRMYISPQVREVTVKVPNDRTVLFLAYPLDTLRPFGGATDPTQNNRTVTLDQNSGVLAEILVNGALEITSDVNFIHLAEEAGKICQDFRYIDEGALLADILNGQLSKASIKKTKGHALEDIEVYDGTWIGESLFDIYLDPSLTTLPAGVHRYYNPQRNLVMSIAVNNDGSYSKYEDRALLAQENLVSYKYE